MKVIYPALALVILAVASATQGAGLAHNETFAVLAPDQTLAEEVLARATPLRKQLAEEWFGEELPPGAGRTLIHVRLSDTEDSALTWVKDNPDRILHRVWLTTTRERALRSLLRHEITHVVFATKFPDRLPMWIEEGIASRKDGQGRVAARQGIVERYAQTGNWPGFKRVFDARTIPANDDTTYTVAASLTEYLLSRGDRATLLRFAIAGKKDGWDKALQEHYALRSVRDLEAGWQAWAGRAARANARSSSPDDGRVSAKALPRR